MRGSEVRILSAAPVHQRQSSIDPLVMRGSVVRILSAAPVFRPSLVEFCPPTRHAMGNTLLSRVRILSAAPLFLTRDFVRHHRA
jgi:hypothetical protein